MRRTLTAAASLVAAFALVGPGAALAEDAPSTPPSTVQAADTHGKGHGLKKIARVKGLKAAAKLLGLSIGQLKQELRSGKSLAQIAAAKGISAETLVNAMLAPLDARLTKAVESGKITASQKAERLAKAHMRVTAAIDRTHTAKQKP